MYVVCCDTSIGASCGRSIQIATATHRQPDDTRHGRNRGPPRELRRIGVAHLIFTRGIRIRRRSQRSVSTSPLSGSIDVAGWLVRASATPRTTRRRWCLRSPSSRPRCRRVPRRLLPPRRSPAAPCFPRFPPAFRRCRRFPRAAPAPAPPPPTSADTGPALARRSASGARRDADGGHDDRPAAPP